MTRLASTASKRARLRFADRDQHVNHYITPPCRVLQGVSIASYASPVLAIVEMSVCPTHAGTEWKRCKLG